MASLPSPLATIPITLHLGDTQIVVGQLVCEAGESTHTGTLLRVPVHGRVEFTREFATYVTEHQAES